MNAEPGWPEIDMFVPDGLQRAQDVAGAGHLLTTPEHRVDWLFATRDVALSRFSVVHGIPDHAALAVTVSPR